MDNKVVKGMLSCDVSVMVEIFLVMCRFVKNILNWIFFVVIVIVKIVYIWFWWNFKNGNSMNVINKNCRLVNKNGGILLMLIFVFMSVRVYMKLILIIRVRCCGVIVGFFLFWWMSVGWCLVFNRKSCYRFSFYW